MIYCPYWMNRLSDHGLTGCLNFTDRNLRPSWCKYNISFYCRRYSETAIYGFRMSKLCPGCRFMYSVLTLPANRLHTWIPHLWLVYCRVVLCWVFFCQLPSWQTAATCAWWSMTSLKWTNPNLNLSREENYTPGTIYVADNFMQLFTGFLFALAFLSWIAGLHCSMCDHMAA